MNLLYNKTKLIENQSKELYIISNMKITPEYIERLAGENGIDISPYNMNQLIDGYKAEEEHDTNDEIDVVKSDVDLYSKGYLID